MTERERERERERDRERQRDRETERERERERDRERERESQISHTILLPVADSVSVTHLSQPPALFGRWTLELQTKISSMKNQDRRLCYYCKYP